MNFQVETIDDVFRNWHFLLEHDVEIEMGPGRHPQSGAIFLYFLGPEGFTYEYSFGVRRIEDDAAWVPRTFDPAEPGSIDMWLGPTTRPITQPQLDPPSRPRPAAPPVHENPAPEATSLDVAGVPTALIDVAPKCPRVLGTSASTGPPPLLLLHALCGLDRGYSVDRGAGGVPDRPHSPDPPQ